jgi:hypothetical protein
VGVENDGRSVGGLDRIGLCCVNSMRQFIAGRDVRQAILARSIEFTLAVYFVNSSRALVGANCLPSWISQVDPPVSDHSTIMVRVFDPS